MWRSHCQEAKRGETSGHRITWVVYLNPADKYPYNTTFSAFLAKNQTAIFVQVFDFSYVVYKVLKYKALYLFEIKGIAVTKAAKILDTKFHISLKLNDIPTSDVVGLSEEEKDEYEATFLDEETGQLPREIDPAALNQWLFNELSYGATCGFSSPDRCFKYSRGANFAEKDA